MIKRNFKLPIRIITVIIAFLALLYSWQIDKKVESVTSLQRKIWSQEQFEQKERDSLINLSKELFAGTKDFEGLDYSNLREIASGPLENRYDELRLRQSIAKWSAVVLILIIVIIQVVFSIKRKN